MAVEEVGARLSVKGRQQAAGELRRFGRDLKDVQGDLDKTGKDAEQLGDRSDRAGKQVGQSFDDAPDKVGRSLDDVVAKIKGGTRLVAGAAALVGVAAGAAMAKGMLDAIGAEQVTDKMAASLDLDAKTADRAERVAKRVYRGAWGESLDQVTDAMAGVNRELGRLSEMSDETIEGLTVKTLDLATTFDRDVFEVVKASGQLVRNNLARDADHALDIITSGLTAGADRADDFFDTLWEYAEPIRSLGLDGEAATDLIIRGLDAGAYSADKLGDALKEFSIRAVDGSETTAEAFDILNLDMEELSQAIAGGGPAAEKAMSTIVRKLGDVDDKVRQDLAGVGLFGSMWEDLGPAAVLSLDPLERKLGDVGGATDRLGDKLNDNVGVKLESAKRRALGALEDLAAQGLPALNRILDKFDQGGLNAAMEQMGVEWEKAWPKVERWLYDDVAPVIVSFGVEVGKALGKAIITGLVSLHGEAAKALREWMDSLAGGRVFAGDTLDDHLAGIGNRGEQRRWAPGPQPVAGAASSPTRTSTVPASARAAGGGVLQGSTYLVGEHGPELVVPQGRATVVPSPQTHRLMSARGGDGAGLGGGVHFHIGTIQGSETVEEIADKMVEAAKTPKVQRAIGAATGSAKASHGTWS